METIYIDATDLLVGRMATFVAKNALLGKKFEIVNCEKAIISGNKANIETDFKNDLQRGRPTKGPFHHRYSDKIVRRAIRGMLPYKCDRGQVAYHNIKCYIGIPKELASQKFITLDNAKKSKLPTLKMMSVGSLSKHLGGRQ